MNCKQKNSATELKSLIEKLCACINIFVLSNLYYLIKNHCIEYECKDMRYCTFLFVWINEVLDY